MQEVCKSIKFPFFILLKLPYELKLKKIVGDKPLKNNHGKIQLLANEKPEEIRVILVIQMLFEYF